MGTTNSRTRTNSWSVPHCHDRCRCNAGGSSDSAPAAGGARSYLSHSRRSDSTSGRTGCCARGAAPLDSNFRATNNPCRSPHPVPPGTARRTACSSGVNHGLRHEALRNIALRTSDGRELKEEPGASPYILAGSTRRWRMIGQGSLPLSNESMRLTAHGDSGTIEQTVAVEAAP
jgi:hypothetical protein